MISSWSVISLNNSSTEKRCSSKWIFVFVHRLWGDDPICIGWSIERELFIIPIHDCFIKTFSFSLMKFEIRSKETNNLFSLEDDSNSLKELFSSDEKKIFWMTKIKLTERSFHRSVRSCLKITWSSFHCWSSITQIHSLSRIWRRFFVSFFKCKENFLGRKDLVDQIWFNDWFDQSSKKKNRERRAFFHQSIIDDDEEMEVFVIQWLNIFQEMKRKSFAPEYEWQSHWVGCCDWKWREWFVMINITMEFDEISSFSIIRWIDLRMNMLILIISAVNVFDWMIEIWKEKIKDVYSPLSNVSPSND